MFTIKNTKDIKGFDGSYGIDWDYTTDDYPYNWPTI